MFHEQHPGREQRRGRRGTAPGVSRRKPGRFIGHADGAHAELLGDPDQTPKYGRVQVKVFVSIDVIQSETSARKRIELCANFRLQLAAQRTAHEISDSARKQVPVHVTVGIHEARNLCRRQRCPAIRQDQVQADAEIRQPVCAPDGIGGCRCADHQARCRQDTAAARLLDGIIDSFVQAEVIGRHDQVPLHIYQLLRLSTIRIQRRSFAVQSTWKCSRGASAASAASGRI
jgi:hypothetical protein